MVSTGWIAVRLPELGDPDGAVVTNWMAEVGEFVEAGEGLVEVLVPGVTVEVAAPVSGRLAAVVSPADSRVRTEDVLGWMEP